jgi:LysM repeat protein
VGGIQPKLTISRPGDPYEQEADQIAERVMRMASLPSSAPDSPNPQSVKSKLPSAVVASYKVQRKYDPCEDEEQKPQLKETEPEGFGIQRKSLAVSAVGDPDEKQADEVARNVVARQPVGTEGPARINADGNGSAQTTPEFQSQLESSKGSGKSLPPDVQIEMGSRMGTDFSKVRVHTGSVANEMSESINARAFTLGSDVYFRQGEYNPVSRPGKELLAHELTHTLQQAGRQVQRQANKTITITVKKKQNLYRIAVEYGTTVAELQKLNNLKNETIQEGQTLKVPTKTSGKQTARKQTDDIYGNLERPRYGDYTITKADLEKSVPYTDPISGTSYISPVKETFYGIWVSYQIDYAYVGAHLKGNDPYGMPRAFAATIVRPQRTHLFFSLDAWNELDIEEKVRAYDNHPSWDLADDIKHKAYPKLNAELERRIRMFKLDNTTKAESLEVTKVLENSQPVLAKDTQFGKWFESHRSWSELFSAPIPIGPLKQLGNNEEAVDQWNKLSLQQKVDYFYKYPEQQSVKPASKK